MCNSWRSRTGSVTWDVLAEDHTWTEEIFRLFELDPAVKINMRMMLNHIHPEDLPAVEGLLGPQSRVPTLSWGSG